MRGSVNLSMRLTCDPNHGANLSFSFCPSTGGDPEKAHKQELRHLHGALQREQVSEREERLRHHPLRSRHQLP